MTRALKPGLVEDNTVPIIAIDFSFTGGSAQDADGKAGTAAMLSSLLDEGAADMDSQAFQTALEDNAIKLSFDAGPRPLLWFAAHPDAEQGHRLRSAGKVPCKLRISTQTRLSACVPNGSFRPSGN